MERGLTVWVSGRRLAGVVEDIVSEGMGWLHGYYARYAIEAGIARAAVLFDSEGPVGVDVFYNVSLGETELCVHYYVVVRPAKQGMGYGKILVLSSEETCHANAYVATTKSTNQRSLRLFSSLCYQGFSWEELAEIIGWDRVHTLMEATCAYEDDVILLKPKDIVWKLGKGRVSSPRRIWKRICWEPWARLYY